MAVSVQMYGIQTLKPTTDSTFNLVYNPNVRPENNNEVRLLVDTSLQVVPAAVNINLPAISQFNGIFTLQLYVIDVNGSAGAFPINIIPAVNDDIDGGSGVSISTNNGNIVLTIAADGYWTTYGSSGSGGGGGGVITTTYANFYNLLSTSSLVAGTTYKITDYRSVNWINGGYNAVNNFIAPSFDAGSFDNSFNRNFIGASIPTFSFVNQDASGNIYTGETGGFFYKTNSNGVIDSSFSANVGTGGSGNAVYDVAFQTDNKIIVVGNFNNWNTSTPTGSIVRLNQNGTLDNAYQTAIGTGFDSTINSCAIQPDNSIVVVGVFANFNGAPVAKGIARITSAGALDAAFNANLGAGLDALGVAYGVTIQNDGKILVSGQFTSVAGVTSQGVVRLNADGTVDAAFAANINNPSGFTGIVQTIVQQPDGKILCGGSFTDFNGNTYRRLARLNADGTDDVVFNTNIGTAFNDSVLSIALDGSNNIICGGDFTNWNTNTAVGKVVRISPSGFLDVTFICPISNNRVYGIIVQSSGNIVVSGDWFYQVNGVIMAQNFYRLLGSSSSVGLNNQEIYVGQTETLIVKALTANTIEQTVFSEQFPFDIIQYIPQCNKLSLGLSVYNGQTLPDSTVVAGFDLQWDGTNAFFILPASYPVLYGQYLYIYFDTGLINYYENFIRVTNFGVNFNPTNVGISSNQIGGSTIEIDSNNIKITLSGISLEDFNNYLPNTLYVDYSYEIGNAYGWITKRNATDLLIDLPYDWRGRKFRRFAGVGNSSSGTWVMPFYSDYFGYLFTKSGLYDDFFTVNSSFTNNIVAANCVGGPSFGYNDDNVDNIVLFNNCSVFSFDGFSNLFSITFNQGGVNCSLVGAGFSNCTFVGNVQALSVNCPASTDNLFDGISYAIFNCREFLSNVFNGILTKCFFTNSVQQNVLIGSLTIFQSDTFASNNINGSIGQSNFYLFQNNNITGNIDNSEANFFYQNNIQASINTLKFGSFFGNTIIVPFQISNVTGDNFNLNSVQTGVFSNNIFNGKFQGNTINNPLGGFQYMTFNCSEAESNFFVGGNFLYNTITVSRFFGNSFNLCIFENNNIDCSVFQGNQFNFAGFATVGVGHNNIECGTFQSNTIKKDMAFNNIQGYFRANILNGNFNLNNISGTFDGNTTALVQQFRTNTFEQTVVIGVDFSASTYVYAQYNCFVFTGNALTLLLEYYDEGTSTWSVVAMTA